MGPPAVPALVGHGRPADLHRRPVARALPHATRHLRRPLRQTAPAPGHEADALARLRPAGEARGRGGPLPRHGRQLQRAVRPVRHRQGDGARLRVGGVPRREGAAGPLHQAAAGGDAAGDRGRVRGGRGFPAVLRGGGCVPRARLSSRRRCQRLLQLQRKLLHYIASCGGSPVPIYQHQRGLGRRHPRRHGAPTLHPVPAGRERRPFPPGHEDHRLDAGAPDAAGSPGVPPAELAADGVPGRRAPHRGAEALQPPAGRRPGGGGGPRLRAAEGEVAVSAEEGGRGRLQGRHRRRLLLRPAQPVRPERRRRRLPGRVAAGRGGTRPRGRRRRPGGRAGAAGRREAGPGGLLLRAGPGGPPTLRRFNDQRRKLNSEKRNKNRFL